MDAFEPIQVSIETDKFSKMVPKHIFNEVRFLFCISHFNRTTILINFQYLIEKLFTSQYLTGQI